MDLLIAQHANLVPKLSAADRNRKINISSLDEQLVNAAARVL